MQLSPKVRSRLAPTPSGYLHLGNLLNFVITWCLTRKNSGTLLLRIDDLDALRARPEYVDEIFFTLDWLGFDWDAGPYSPDDFTKNYSQRLKTEEYRASLSLFPGYACSCSRQTIAQRTNAPYDGHCRNLNLPLIKDQTQWRVRESDPAHDIVLWRKEDLPSYQLVSLLEDLHFGSTLIVRGEDLKDSTEMQKRLATMLGSKGTPFMEATFIHHPLLLDSNGEKLSKSAGASSLKYMRESGMSSQNTFIELSKRAGWPIVTSLKEALQELPIIL